MSSDVPSDPKLKIAHVLTMDVVEYSTLLITDQSRVMAELTRTVQNSARFKRAETEGKLLRLPTGDGMALVFFDDPEAPIECAIEISAAIKNHSDIRLRMGIHSGPVNQIVDVNNRSNIAGAGIDVAQRVMDCGDAGHILLSKRVAEDLAPLPRWNPHLHELGECEVKHGRKISLVNFYTAEVGNPEPPAKCRAPKQEVDLRPAPDKVAGVFPPKGALIGAAVLLTVTLMIGLWIFSQHGPGKRTGESAQTNSKSIAVLPFENLSHDPENAYFADGIQEEILTRLSKISDLKVISRTSTQRYKSAPSNLSEIAKQLGVAHILEGSVQKAADQVRVNVQLINAENDSHVWAEKFDRKLTDIFVVETEIAAKIADTLQAKLTGAEQRAIASRPTNNSEAHQLYLKGRYYWNKWLAPGFEKSRDYYQQAIDLDPTYALAYAGLADYYGFCFAIGLLPPEEKWAKAEEETAAKALELDPTLGEAYNPLAAAKLYYHRDWPGAERYFHRGFELSPNFAEMHHHYALCLVFFGRNEEALAEMQRAIELDPLSSRFALSWARLLFFMRQYDRALDQYGRALELDPNYAMVHEWLGYTYEKKGMQKEAIAEWSRALTLSDETELASILEQTYATSGFGTAVRTLAQKRLERLNERTGRGEYVPAVEYMTAYMRLGDEEQAFAWLAKAADERNRLAFEIKINPIFDPLRSDPRFEQLMEKVSGTSKNKIQSKSIAVLPFENLSGDPDNAYFADGIQEEILGRLSKIADLKVISRTSTQRYKTKPDNLLEIAKQLGVANILEGTVQKAADQVRVNVQLINAQNDSHLWADKYDRKLADIFAVESEIATKIAETLQAKLTGAEQHAIVGRPTENSEAHQLYLKGRYFAGKRNRDDLKKALDYFNQAIAKDPNYARAYAGIADCYVLLVQWSDQPPPESFSKAKIAAQKALELDNSLGEAHASLGLVLFNNELNIRAAKREYERALALNPNYAPAHHWFGHTVLASLGEKDRSIAELKRALELDPFSTIINANLGVAYYLARRYPEAIAQLRKTMELDPAFFYPHVVLGQTLVMSGQFEEALAEYHKAAAFAQDPTDPDEAVSLAHAYALKGERAKALPLVEDLKQRAQRDKLWAYGLACVYGALGQNDEAIRWLERSYETEKNGSICFIKVDPFLDPLRGDPRFQKLANQVVPQDAKNE